MTPPGKKETLLAYLGKGIAMVHLDARRKGVAVPEQHVDDPHLRLNLSYRYGIPDLVVDGEKVQATLSFRGRPFQCKLPWSAVFGITSQTTGEGQVWPEDLPGEVVNALTEHDDLGAGKPGSDDASDPARPGAAGAAGNAEPKGKPRKRREPARKRPALVAVESAPEPEADGAGAENPAGASATASTGKTAVKPSDRPAARAAEAERSGNDGAPDQGAPLAATAAPAGGPRRSHLRLVR